MILPPNINVALVFADGKCFYGEGIGVPQNITGEVCFNTSLTGYQEVMTDPSYQGQIVNFTFPHIGNVGANKIDVENRVSGIGAVGLIIGENITKPSNFRAESDLNSWLIDNNKTGIAGVDTREITKYIRENGAQNIVISYRKENNRFDIAELQKLAQQAPNLDGLDLAKDVTGQGIYDWTERLYTLEEGNSNNNISQQKKHIVAIDFGAKLNILRHFANRECKVTVVPANTQAKDILDLNPDGIFLSNGPGDPAATGKYSVPVIQQLIESGKPIFGICLGHQMLCLAVGLKTKKMHQGHRGANHPVKRYADGSVEITSQNHGFVVDEQQIPEGVTITHKSLFDNTIEGIELEGKNIFSVQYHPEASPGPQDSDYLFDKFVEML